MTQTKTYDAPANFAYRGWEDDQAEWLDLLEQHGGTIKAWTPDPVERAAVRQERSNDRLILQRLHESSLKYDRKVPDPKPIPYPIHKFGGRWVCDGPRGRFHTKTKAEAVRQLLADLASPYAAETEAS